jgi:hypothetical protein
MPALEWLSSCVRKRRLAVRSPVHGSAEFCAAVVSFDNAHTRRSFAREHPALCSAHPMAQHFLPVSAKQYFLPSHQMSPRPFDTWVMLPGCAILLNGFVQPFNREIGVPGFQPIRVVPSVC